MTGTRQVLGEGPLTYGRVMHEAWGMFRLRYLRVAVVALIIFIPPPLLAALAEGLRTSLEAEPGLVRGLGWFVGLLLATMIRLFGPVVYAGYLDEAVGQAYFRGRDLRLHDVLARLPWLRLVAAEVVLVTGATVGLALFVVPGLIWLTLFGLIGPVIVREGRGVVDGFRRTYQLGRQAWRMILVLVAGLLILENVAHEVVHEWFHHTAFWLQLAASWVFATVVGGVVGLVEVALASELMARVPARTASGQESDPATG